MILTVITDKNGILIQLIDINQIQVLTPGNNGLSPVAEIVNIASEPRGIRIQINHVQLEAGRIRRFLDSNTQ